MLNGLYPFQGKYLNIGGFRLHFLDEGTGESVVMLHGNPTWSFYYRRLVLALPGSCRCKDNRRRTRDARARQQKTKNQNQIAHRELTLPRQGSHVLKDVFLKPEIPVIVDATGALTID